MQNENGSKVQNMEAVQPKATVFVSQTYISHAQRKASKAMDEATGEAVAEKKVTTLKT